MKTGLALDRHCERMQQLTKAKRLSARGNPGAEFKGCDL
jgi:hypothetical protein